MPVIRTLLPAAMLIALPGLAAAAEATASLADSAGSPVGAVTFAATASGMVLVVVTAEGLPPGAHAIHIHETGDCSAADFSSAGGHLALGHEHGVMTAGGPHPGDLPNLHVAGDGAVTTEHFTDRISLGFEAGNPLFDRDGTAVVVHAGADDYGSQPSGNSGDRLACGVIERGVVERARG